MSSVVASSSTLWAQASKEWVIPAKPKPGRKPKKDPPAPPVDESMEPDSKGRRVQNRAAQRAFRERKQSQLADLQARVQSYEQGEMERNVALQNIAKRLKDENEILRKENASLREELRKLRPENSPETERKRWREDSSTPYASRDIMSRKRIKTDGLPSLSPESVPSSTMSLLHSPSSIGSSPESDSATSSVPNDPYSPMSFSPRSPNPPVYPQHTQPAMASLFSGFSGKVPGCINENRVPNSFDQAFDMVDCGFCSDDTTCVCRELALQQVAARITAQGEAPNTGASISANATSAAQGGSHSPPEIKMESRGSISISSTPQMPPATIPMQPFPSNNNLSILDNLPAYSPPVPLPRRRSSEQSTHPPIFPIFPAQALPQRQLRPTRTTSPTCTGDPANCLACADDPFGKAFCAALGGSVKECGSCPNNGSPTNAGFIGCGGCGNPGLCGGAGSNPDRPPSSSAPRSASISSASSPGHLSNMSETVPCNTAWAQLKSHPNIAFADLTLLADVVARRSKCTGPRVVLSPDPELEALARRQQQSDGSAVDRGSDDMPILLTDPHAQYHEQAHSRGQGSPSSTPEAHLQCGRQRVIEVEADGVRDALAMLDGQYQRS
ncbi:hypothetical protein K439DRAFT_1643890 [Ramaria rubella]|nr:hypothetical protein K439DRAFT_1643890 [Ramaria rubella]